MLGRYLAPLIFNNQFRNILANFSERGFPMIREILRCPYCAAVIALDDVSQEILFEPDRCRGAACPHLTCSWVAVTVMRGRRTVKGRCSSRLWELGRGLYQVDGFRDFRALGLTNYLCDHGFERLEPRLRPTTPHTIVGGSAMQREEAHSGSGEFMVTIDGRHYTLLLDAWGIFSPDPRSVMDEMSLLAHEYEV